MSKRSARRRRLLRTDDREAIADFGAAAIQLARGELDYRKCAHAPRDPPRGNVVPRFQHAPVSRDKDDVDGKSHEERVHEIRGSEDEGVSRRQTLASEQTAVAGMRISGKLENGRKELTRAVVSERNRTGRPPQQRLKEMRLQRRRLTAEYQTG